MSEETKNLMTSLRGMHLQWFAGLDVDGEDDPVMDFEPPEEGGEEEEEEIIVLKPGEKPPEEEEEGAGQEDEDKVKRAEELEALRTQVADLSQRAAATESTSGLANTIAEAINRQRVEGDLNKPSAESDKEFGARLEKDLFKPGMTFDAFKEAVFRVVGPAWSQTIGATVDQSRKLLEVHPEKRERFIKYKAEIEARREALPYPQRNSPDVYDKLYDEVVASHSEELNQEAVQAEVIKQVAVALKEYGIDPGGEPKKGKATFTERGGPRSSAPKKKRVIVTAEDHRRAEEDGVTDKEYMASKIRRGV